MILNLTDLLSIRNKLLYNFVHLEYDNFDKYYNINFTLNNLRSNCACKIGDV